MEIAVGDVVKVIDPGRVYPSYLGFYDEQGFSGLKSKHKDRISRYTEGTVLFRGKHVFGTPVVYAIDVECDGGGIVLVGESGIELVRSSVDLPIPEISVNEESIDALLGLMGGAPCY